MTRYRLFIMMIFCVLSQASGQWHWLNPLPEGNEYFDATFVASGTGPATIWVVGGNGSIIRSSDEGVTWSARNTPLRPTPFLCLNVLFTDATTGLVASNTGTLLRTNDAGGVWQQLPPNGMPIQKLRRAPDGGVWGFGSVGTLARTGDAGLTWTKRYPGTNAVVFDVAFPDASNIVAVCGSGAIYRSANGGQQWTSTVRPLPTDIVSVDFISPTHGFALQKPTTLLRTTDGGANWSDTTLSVLSVRCIRFSNPTTGWLLSTSTGTVLKTVNAGQTWRTVTVDSSLRYTFQNIIVRSQNEIWLTGEGGGMFRSLDGGATWTQLGTAITRTHLSAITGVSDSSAWIFGDGLVKFTGDRGATWSDNKAGALPIHCGAAVSATRIVAGGPQGEVHFSDNSGATWTTHTLASLGQVNQIRFLNGSVGWLAGNHGTVARTLDGGATWTLAAPDDNDYNSVHPLSADVAWIAGNGGTVRKTTDGGATWSTHDPGTTSNLYTIHFTSPTDGWVGGQVKLYQTFDGGNTWSPRSQQGLDVVYRVAFADPQNGFLLMSRGIARTSDGGTTFHRTDYPSTGLRDVSALPDGHLWLAGDFGVALRYTPAPVVFLTPAVLDFGDVSTGKTKTLPFTIENAGERTMRISNLTTLGNGFTIASMGDTTLAPGARTTARIQFTPPDTGIHRGLATVISNAPLGVPTVPLIGHGIPPGTPALTHAPQILDFGKIRLGTIKSLELRITNSSSRLLRINEERLVGQDSMMFQVVRPSSFLINAGATDSIQIVFAPLRPEPFTTTLLIESDDAAEPAYRVTVRGEAINPKITLIPDTVNFGFVFTDSTKTLYLEIKNAGSAELLTANHRIVGTDAADFSFVPPPATPIGPGSSVLIPVSFHPKTMGPKSAQLRIESSDIINPEVAAILIGRPTNTGTHEAPQAPSALIIGSTYPNPVGPGTAHRAMVTFVLPEAALVQTRVTDALGRDVTTPITGRYAPGENRALVNAAALPAGLYHVAVTAEYGNGTISTAQARILVVR